MKRRLKQVIKKMEEYDITIFKHHDGDDEQYVFFCEHMVLFVHPDNTLSVAFQATTKPHVAATFILILKEIPNVDILIMEPFIYCSDNKLLCGDEAYKLIKETIKAEGATDYMKEEAYTHLLNNANCHEC
ncbi:MAG TPA: hypothetical protein VMX17_08535 [Candidatus Glassbacteria bacterium]|nr:hypothetical protein [Candidatus Glassbacteria bacterium]